MRSPRATLTEPLRTSAQSVRPRASSCQPQKAAGPVDDLALALLVGAPLPATPPAAAAPAPPHPAIALPAAALDRFLGDYLLAPSFVLAVRRAGDHLTAQATGQPAFELLAEPPTTFRFRALDARVEFQADVSGAVTGLVLVQNGASTCSARSPSASATSSASAREAAGQAGLAAARARGRMGGRPRALSPTHVAMARALLADPARPIPEICAALRVSKATLYRYVPARSRRVGAAGPPTS